MDRIVIQICNMSVAASWLILAVICLRFLFKKAPKWIRFCLWALVAVRLLVPLDIESKISLVPDLSRIGINELMSKNSKESNSNPSDNKIADTTVNSNIVIANNNSEKTIQNSTSSQKDNNVSNEKTTTNRNKDIGIIVAYIWITGMLMMLFYFLLSIIFVRKRIKESVPINDAIFRSDRITNPFVFGFIHPKIYIPSGMESEALDYVILHEKVHIRHKDHFIKPFGFAVLTIYWFHPLVWVSYILLCRDIEMACDERVIRKLGKNERADYSEILLLYSTKRKSMKACPIAFGEVGVKERIKNILNYKKPALWLIIIAMIACIVAAACFLTNSKHKKENLVPKKVSEKSTNKNFPSGMEQKELTLNDWESLVSPEGIIDQYIKEDGVDYFKKFKNVQYGEEFKDTGYLYYDYTYNLEPYQIRVYYYENGNIYSINIIKMNTEEIQLLWKNNDKYTPNTDLQSFLEYNSSMEQYVTYEAPEAVNVTDFNGNIGNGGGGCLFLKEGKLKDAGFAPDEWRSAGGIMILSSKLLEFSNGSISKADLDYNHCWSVSDSETVNGCEVSVVIRQYEFDLYTATESAEAGLPYEATIARYWYVFMGKENGARGFAFFLDSDIYSKEDAIKLAQSAHFTEQAFE